MRWSFHPDQVVSGTIAYRLDDFRRDLMHHVESGFPYCSPREIQGLFNLNYLMLYWLATGGSFGEFIEEFEWQLRPTPWVRAHLAWLRRECGAEVAMLAAILRRMTLDRIEAGLPDERAWLETHDEQARIAAVPQPMPEGGRPAA